MKFVLRRMILPVIVGLGLTGCTVMTKEEHMDMHQQAHKEMMTSEAHKNMMQKMMKDMMPEMMKDMMKKEKTE